MTDLDAAKDQLALKQLGISARGAVFERDWRIDVWRGLAVLMIFVNHLGPNAFAMITTRNWGFSDAAELFVFLSGISTARVLARGRDKPLGALTWTMRRAVKLYGYHLALFLALGVMGACYLALAESYALIDALQFAPFFARTEVMLIKAAALTFLPTYADILPLYIVLTLLAGLLYTATKARTGAVFGLSFLLYAAARTFGWNLPADDGGRSWFFNPFTWQFLFVSGMTVWNLRTHNGFQMLLRSRAMLAASATLLTVATVAAAPWTLGGAFQGWRPFAADIAPFLDKQNLSPLRLAHFLAAAHIGYVLLPMSSRLRHGILARHLSAVGRHALNMFLLGCILTALALAFDLYWGHGFTATTGMSAAGTILIVGCARYLDSLRARPGAAFALEKAPASHGRGHFEHATQAASPSSSREAT
jgi:hypothetical protein